MTMTTNAAGRSARPWWSMTSDALSGLRAKAEQLAGDADGTGGYVTAHMSGEPDAPTLLTNIDGQRLLRQLNGVRGALALARVETDARLAVSDGASPSPARMGVEQALPSSSRATVTWPTAGCRSTRRSVEPSMDAERAMRSASMLQMGRGRRPSIQSNERRSRR